YPKGSDDEASFLDATSALVNIPGVKNFEQLKQTSLKNKFDFGLSMQFKNRDDYEEYNSHPLHTRFIQQYWIPGVEEFLETDYEPLR
ncbi:MAG TPA: Dabb family protein, partial [Agriterribacter sp.]|nr:Dabb family protein [Agriterribacter sp.]